MNKSIFLFGILLGICVELCYSQNTEFCRSVSTTINCNASERFRLLNGRCNNLNSPFRGASHTKYTRMISPRFADGFSAVPRSVTGAELPSARIVSTTCFPDTRVPDRQLSLAAMNMGHLVAHDMALTNANTEGNGCCRNGNLIPNPDNFCWAIPIPPTDPIHRISCMNFNRNLFDMNAGCVDYRGDGFVQQINRVTSFLDMSVLYGNREPELLRSFSDGKMRVVTRNGATWPPDALDRSRCRVETDSEPCYMSGDNRLNQTPHLVIMQILFLREHNRIADGLKAVNPSWDDERLFQESRRINIAQYQYITYYEWLPHILGLNNMRSAGLYVHDSGSAYVNDYDVNADPSTRNEFTGPAFRYFHSMVAGILNLLTEQRALIGTERLSDVLRRPGIIEANDNFRALLRGMITQPSESRDIHVDPEIQSFLFRGRNTFGNDLKALDIQRDRDHGIGSYNTMRVAAGLRRATSFNDLLDVISATNVANLRNVYAHVDDIDLSVGGDMEMPRDNSVGHGMSYHRIFLEQFRGTRVGDRFWFESSSSPYPFTPSQLSEIRKTSFSRIICDNSNGIQTVQPDAFALPNSLNNVITACNRIPTVNLSAWRE